MKLNRANLLSAGLVAGSFAAAAVLYRRLPDPVPVHWGAHGQVNGYMAKPWGAFLMPLATLGTSLLLFALSRIAPRGLSIQRFRGTFDVIQTAIVGFMSFTTLMALLAGAGSPVAVARAVPVAVGILFMILGNVLGKVTRNWFVGIRTPWTMASDEVWLRTHRFGGRVFMLAGLALAITGLAAGGVMPVLVSVLAAALIPVAYSYVVYRRLEGPTRHAP
jgi:uncharacterized membrane protein